MRRVSGGYTITEIMIFLAISLFIAAAAWNLISGEQARTDFNQKMRDTQSKLQDWINDTTTGDTGGDPGQQSCVPDSNNRPQILNKPNSAIPGYSPNCTFLGKAIQFTDPASFSGEVANQNNTLYVYSVFGCRLAKCNSNADLSASMADANPEPAIGQSSSPVDLTDSFDLGPAYVKSVCGKTPGGASCTSSHLIGFMNTFNTDNNASANGAENLNAYLYNLNGNATPADASGSDGKVRTCIEGGSGACQLSAGQNPPSLSSYTVCLTDGERYADITITSASGIGASVNLTYASQATC